MSKNGKNILETVNATLEKDLPHIEAAFAPAEDESVDDSIEFFDRKTGNKSVVSIQIGSDYVCCNALNYAKTELAPGIVFRSLESSVAGKMRLPRQAPAIASDALKMLREHAGETEPTGGAGIALHPLSPIIVRAILPYCEQTRLQLSVNSADISFHDEDVFSIVEPGGEIKDVCVVTIPGGCKAVRPSNGTVLQKFERGRTSDLDLSDLAKVMDTEINPPSSVTAS